MNHKFTSDLNTVTVPVWWWVLVFSMQLFGANDWGDAAVAVLFISLPFGFRLIERTYEIK